MAFSCGGFGVVWGIFENGELKIGVPVESYLLAFQFYSNTPRGAIFTGLESLDVYDYPTGSEITRGKCGNSPC